MIQGHNKLEIRLDFYRGIDGIYQSYWVNKFMRSFYKQGKAAVIERHTYNALRLMRLLRMQGEPVASNKLKTRTWLKPHTLRVIRRIQKQKRLKALAKTKQQILKKQIARWKRLPIASFAASFGFHSTLWARWLRWLKKKPDLTRAFTNQNRWVKLKWNRALGSAKKRKIILPRWIDFIKTRSIAVQHRWALFDQKYKKPSKWLVYKTWPNFVRQSSSEFQKHFNAFYKKANQKCSGGAILLEIIESVKPILTTRAKNRGRGRKGREYPYILPKAKQYLMATRWLKKEVDYYWQSERALYKRIMAILNDRGSLMKHFLIERRSEMFEAAVENRQRARWSWLGRK